LLIHCSVKINQMFRHILLCLLFGSLTIVSNGQNNSKWLQITIKDNISMQFISNDYFVTKDSVVIIGDSDYGRTKVNYTRRKLTKDERKKLESFLKTFPADSLEDAYFNDFKNMGYISPEHFPRVINVDIDYNGKKYTTKMTNCYVYKLANLFNFLNEFFPPEVRIKLNKDEFNAFF
jgi:hypothetical protein